MDVSGIYFSLSVFTLVIMFNVNTVLHRAYSEFPCLRERVDIYSVSGGITP